MIKLKDLLQRKENEAKSKVIQGTYRPTSDKELREIESLESLEVNGFLVLKGTNISRLPNNLKIEGSLSASNTKITKLPENLEVKYHIDLSYSELKELPDNFKCPGTLNITGTKIKKLPDNLSVHNMLLASDTDITEVPNGLRVGLGFYIGDTPLAGKYKHRELLKLIREKGGSLGMNVFKHYAPKVYSRREYELGRQNQGKK